MLTSLNRMIGLPVVLGDRSLGRVERAALDPCARRFAGLVARRGIGMARWIPADSVALVGKRCVLLRAAPPRAACEPTREALIALGTSGERVGEVTDALLRGDTLGLVALEVSLGPLYRLMGRIAYADRYQARRDERAVILSRLLTWAELAETLGEEDGE